jgi:hypothetical protein
MQMIAAQLVANIVGAKAKLGRCPKCMRSSFVFAAALWGAALGAGQFGAWRALAIALLAAALAAGALWLAHLAAYAFRSADGVDPARRRAIPAFAKAFAIIAIATMAGPRIAFAFPGQCTRDDDCGVGWKCCNTSCEQVSTCGK